MQFGPTEDFDRYPRTLNADLEKLIQAQVDFVFTPSLESIYPEGGKRSKTEVNLPTLSNKLCGLSRPGFFTGIATVVLKLLNLIRPHSIILGEKDRQQLLIIQQLIRDLFLPIKVIGAPIIRETDGLAMSSRNQYLNAEHRKLAPLIYQQLQDTAQQIKLKQTDFAGLCQTAKNRLHTAGFVVDYFEVRCLPDLELANALDQNCFIFAAANLGSTRLIDNIII